MIKLAYCAGHGYNTPGKRTPDGEREWTFNNIVATAFANELSKYDGITLKRFDDPTGKTDVPLIDRTNGANKWGADYYISFHHNANTAKWGDWTGVETYVYLQPGDKALALANAVHPALVKGYGLRDRGIKKKDLHIVRETKCPAILVEGGFMDSIIDIKVLRDEARLKNAGKLIAQAVARYLKLKLKEEKQTTQETTNNKQPTTSNNETYKVVTDIYGYKTAADAKSRKNKATTIKSGSYYIYKKSDGMINVSSKSNTAGSWINPSDNVKSNAIKVGSIVKVKKGAKSYEGKPISSFVYNNTYKVDALSGKRAVLDRKGICTAFNIDDLIFVK